ncbi:MAG: NAD-dependent epimerase/dehydratase family protein [Bacillota bacterium]
MKSPSKRPVVVIAGATGFVGKALISALRSHYRLICLTRGQIDESNVFCNPDITWRQCDLFSLIDAEKALGCADYAFYLVHSMMPSARLTQGSFEDMDLIMADNFARAASLNGIKQIIYLGGLVPDKGKKLSLHLRSRLEVEKTLGSYGVPVTALRAGLIIGAEGSTFRILVRLVERMRFMVLPKWMYSLTHPISLSDVIEIMRYCLGNPFTFNQSFDIGGPDVMTYHDMVKKIAEVMGYKRHILTIPFFSSKLAGLLLSLFTNSPKSLVAPLVESIKTPMVAGNLRLQNEMSLPGMSFDKSVKLALSIKSGVNERTTPRKKSKKLSKQNNVMSVRSVQRLPLPGGIDADWVALHYSTWLPGLFKTFIKVKVDYKGCYFYFRFLRKSLLDLTFSHDRSSKDRPLYYITGGLLARLNLLPHKGRFEFREVLDNKYVLAAIHDYVPTIPWFIYNLTQARLHIWVMHKFGKHLTQINGNQ